VLADVRDDDGIGSHIAAGSNRGYRTLDNRINGVVVTFADITESKAIEAELRKRQIALEIRVKKDNEALHKAEPKQGV
jgi:hypothetical protein